MLALIVLQYNRVKLFEYQAATHSTNKKRCQSFLFASVAVILFDYSAIWSDKERKKEEKWVKSAIIKVSSRLTKLVRAWLAINHRWDDKFSHSSFQCQTRKTRKKNVEAATLIGMFSLFIGHGRWVVFPKRKWPTWTTLVSFSMFDSKGTIRST